jgi:hypothetical protein
MVALIAAVERLSGRQALTFTSNHHVGPDLEIEPFMLTPHGTTGTERRVTPHGHAKI